MVNTDVFVRICSLITLCDVRLCIGSCTVWQPAGYTLTDVFVYSVGRDSSVGIATGYGMDGPGIESRWGRDFPHLFRPVLGPTQPPVQ